MAFGTLVNSGIEKDSSEKQEISAKQCPKKNGKKGFWVCNEIIYNDGKKCNRCEGRKRIGCGCLYEPKYKDRLNLFYDDKYKEEDDAE